MTLQELVTSLCIDQPIIAITVQGHRRPVWGQFPTATTFRTIERVYQIDELPPIRAVYSFLGTTLWRLVESTPDAAAGLSL